MFSYNVYEEANNAEFEKACNLIEKHFLVEKQLPLIDVDGSIIQEYISDNGVIKVFNDYEVGAVYIDSDLKLNDIFSINPVPLKIEEL